MTRSPRRDLSPRPESQTRNASAVANALPLIASHVDAALLGLARRAASVIRLSAGERLFHTGDVVPGLHLIAEGAIRVMRATPDRGVVIHHEFAGGLLGEVALFSDGRYPATAIATEPTLVLLVGEAEVHRALRQDSVLAMLLLHRLAARAKDVISRLDRIANLTVMRRLALHLLERAGAGRGRIVTLGMTQVQLAEELGTVKEIITRELRALVRLGLIARQGAGRYAIRDREGLQGIAGASRHRKG